MYVPDKLKLNKFQFVDIPKPRNYFQRFGFQDPKVNQFTGEEIAVMSSSKLDDIHYGERVNSKYLEFETKQADDSLKVETS